jgi:radical SAM-linked protein
MRPKALLTLVLPLAVGVCGRGEMCEFELAEEPPSGFIARLVSSLPPGMQVVSSAPYHAARRAAGRVIGATYEVTVTTDLAVGCAGERFARAVRLFAEAAAVPVLVAKGDGVRSTDVKTFVDSLEVRPGEGNDRVVVFTARVSPSGTVRPETVTASLAVLGGFELDVTKIERTEILLS